ncbi:MAG: secretin N-terminal domain-containing protein, partial [Candidatus Binatia bacterium]
MRKLALILAGFCTATVAVAQAPAPTPAPAPQAARPREKQLITMDFQDVEIGVLVKFISEITGKNFILDEKIRGKVTVVSPTKITIEEAYRVFQSILQVKGFTTVPAGPVTKIVPVHEAKESGAPVSRVVPVGAEFTTQLVPLSFVDASSLVPVLQPMVSKDGLITAYDATNTIILIDSASNIDRLLEVITDLDIEVPERGIEFIKLENAYATQVAETLQQILEAGQEEATGRQRQPRPRTGQAPTTTTGAAAAATFRVIPDERTNSLIVLASGSQMRSIKSLIQSLDQKLEGVSRINVYRLKYANAVEMVEVLSQLIGGG